MTERPVLQKSLKTSFGQLWKHSPLWRFTLLVAGITAAVFLIYPPWQSDALQPIKTSSTAPKILTVSHGPHENAIPAPSPVQYLVTPTIVATLPAAKSTVKPQPDAKPNLAHHSVEHATKHSRRIARLHQEANEQNNEPMTSPVIDASASPAAAAEPSKGISSEIVAADQNCNNVGPMVGPLNAPLPVQGRIIAFIPPTQAMAMIPQSEKAANSKIDPHYVQNLRVVFRPDGAPMYVQPLAAVVPLGMNAYVGEQVLFIGGHASPNLACHYIPNLVMKGSRY